MRTFSIIIVRPIDSAVVVFLFLAGLWFTEAIINGPDFHPKLTSAAPTIGYSVSCCISCWLAQQDSADSWTGPAGRRPAASHNNYSTDFTWTTVLKYRTELKYWTWLKAYNMKRTCTQHLSHNYYYCPSRSINNSTVNKLFIVSLPGNGLRSPNYAVNQWSFYTPPKGGGVKTRDPRPSSWDTTRPE